MPTTSGFSVTAFTASAAISADSTAPRAISLVVMASAAISIVPTALGFISIVTSLIAAPTPPVTFKSVEVILPSAIIVVGSTSRAPAAF